MVLANLTRRLFAPGSPTGPDGPAFRPAGRDQGGAGAPGTAVTDAGMRGQARALLGGLRLAPELTQIQIPPAVSGIRLIVLLMVVITVPLSTQDFGRDASGITVAVALAVSAVAGVIWQTADSRPRLWVAAIAVMGLGGGVLAGLSPLSTAIAIGFMVTVTAGARLPIGLSVAVVSETALAFLVAALVSGAPAEAIVGWAAGFFGMWAFGLTRRAYVFRAVEAEQALEQARRAHDAERQAAALAERARIAREIHDVLAHSLAAVSVNLQAAEGLLEAVPGQGPELAKAIECVERAGALTKEGMAETRRAILALRDDDTGPGYAAPGAVEASATAEEARGADRLTARLRALADEYGGDSGTAVDFTISGSPRPLGAERALAVFRTAQEAVTNAIKHAPGQPVNLAVCYTAAETVLLVSNPLPTSGSEGPLAHAGAGYGLTGLRERAELVGGTLSAGTADGEWRVRLQLPT